MPGGARRGRGPLGRMALLALLAVLVGTACSDGASASPPRRPARSAMARAAGVSADVRALAAGQDHTCALLASGSVECWGDNGYGQLGDGTSRGPQSCNGDPCASRPLAVRGVSDATAIAAGGDESCALRSGGSVECWGENTYGQLGDGTSRGPQLCGVYPCSEAPVAVRGISGASAIAVGADDACALVAGGSVQCWGENSFGQLGDGTSEGPQICNGEPCASAPVTVPAITGASAIAVGGVVSCALIGGGGVDCWGANNYGQLGEGTSRGPQSCAGEACSLTPVSVAAISTATAIAAGNDHACALLAGGGVDCWGYNFAAELGIATSSGVQWCSGGEWCATRPVAVYGMTSATSIVAGGDHTCVLVSAGGVECWGYNSYGQLGDGLSNGPQVCYWQVVQCAKTPVAVSAIAGATALAAGGEHTCALLSGSSISCWGDNWFGDLGDGALSGPRSCNGYPCSATPVVVSQPPS